MAVVRTYECPDCTARLGKPFTFDKLHFDTSEPAPDCPGCVAFDATPAEPRQRPRRIPAGFSINGNASKAGDIAQNILETDYGMSDIKDRQREGDISAVTPPHLRAAIDGMWKPSGDVMAAAKVGAQAAKSEGVNPLTMTQRVAKDRGTGRPHVQVVARA